MPIVGEMWWWIRLDEELVGALDSNGCFHEPTATNAMLTAYGVSDPDGQAVAREVLRYIGIGRAEALFEDD